MMTKPIEDVLTHLENVKPKSGGGWMALCPAHADRNPSLSIDQGDDGRVLIKCMAGCDTEDVLQAAGLTMADLFPDSRNQQPQIVATYDYRDADGDLLFQVVKKHPKAFTQRRPSGAGGWIWNLQGVERVLYRLPELLAADPDELVFVAEGEKSADAVADLGFVATTNPHGAGKWRARYNHWLRDRQVIILPDNDDDGRKHAQEVAQALDGVASRVTVLELPGLPSKGDVCDWIDAGGTAEELLKLANEVPAWIPDGDSTPAVGWTKYLADALLAADHFAQDAGGRLYRYADGVYRADAKEHVARRTLELLESWGAAKRWSRYRVSEVTEYIRVGSPILQNRPPMDVLNVKNGLLQVAAGKLLPHTPEHLGMIQLPIEYDPDADCLAWYEFLEDVFPEDCQDLPFELAAWLMLPYTTIQKAVLLLGAGENGKSRFLKAIKSFLGKENVAGLSLHKLEMGRFATARLVGKLANICPDLPSEHLASTSVFKALTGGDLIHAERKYGESFEFENFARLLFSANHPPQSSDSSNAFFRRWLVVPFERTFSPDDPDYVPAHKLDAMLADPAELSGVLNRALIALPKVLEEGITETETMRQAWYEFREVTDPVEVWLDLNTVENPETYVEKGDLLRAYNRDAKTDGRPPMTAGLMGKAVKQWKPRLQDGQKRVGDRRPLVWYGIGLRVKEHLEG
jgi:putative DNA primase/helicase